MFNKKDKKKFISEIIKKLKKSFSFVILNFNNLSANKLNLFRKDIKNNDANILVIRNNLLKISVKKSNLSYLNNFLIGPVILGFSVKNYNGLLDVLSKYLIKFKDNLILRCISIDRKLIPLKLSKKIFFLSSIKKSLSYLIFILKNFFLFRLLRILLKIKNIKS